MIDTIKKTILAGIGAAAVTKDKVQAGLEDLVRQGKITAEEARATAERIAREGKREFEAASERLGDGVRDLLARADGKFLARIEALEARVDALEGKTAKASKPRPKA
jgi:polyhydroxyalkanoate synthesis regulator phasin